MKRICTKIVISKIHLSKLIEEAERAYPHETSALLFGGFEREAAYVTGLYVTGTARPSTVSFEVDSAILLDAYSKADEEGKDVVAIFHTHPAPPRPSGIDIEYMMINPIIWLIMSMPSKKLKAYQWNEGSIIPVEIVIK